MVNIEGSARRLSRRDTFAMFAASAVMLGGSQVDNAVNIAANTVTFAQEANNFRKNWQVLSEFKNPPDITRMLQHQRYITLPTDQKGKILPGTIINNGDSIALGYQDGSADPIAARLFYALGAGWKYIELSKNGATSADTKEQLVQDEEQLVKVENGIITASFSGDDFQRIAKSRERIELMKQLIHEMPKNPTNILDPLVRSWMKKASPFVEEFLTEGDALQGRIFEYFKTLNGLIRKGAKIHSIILYTLPDESHAEFINIPAANGSKLHKEIDGTFTRVEELPVRSDPETAHIAGVVSDFISGFTIQGTKNALDRLRMPINARFLNLQETLQDDKDFSGYHPSTQGRQKAYEKMLHGIKAGDETLYNRFQTQAEENKKIFSFQRKLSAA